MSKNFRRIGAAVAATAIALVGAVAVAAPAHAVNVDPAEDGSINITKLVQPGGVLPTTPGDVTTAPVGAEGVPGVDFTVYQLTYNGTPIDLTTTAGWDLYEDIVSDFPGGNPTEADLTTAPYGLTVVGTQTSGATGVVPAFTGLDLSVYFVVEDASANPEVIEESAPFLVSVPMPTADNEWIYDVFVYPKNVTTEFGKTYDANGAQGLGDEVEWTITATVPQLADGVDMTEFGMDDTLSTNLTYVSGSMTLTDADGTTTVPVDPAFYTITAAPATTVTLEFLPAGLAVLDANPNATVAFTLVTEVTSLGTTGVTDNTGTVRINGVPRTTPPVTTYWGAVRISKVDDSAGDGLEGAVFQVFASEAEARAGTPAIAALPNANTPTDEYPTDADGFVTIAGLLTDTTTPVTYYLREIVAPIGYQLPAPADAVGTAADPAITSVVVEPNGSTTPVADITAEIDNDQVPAWALPLTGGGGQTAFLIAGGALLLVAAGAAVFFTARRRKAHTTA